VSLGDPTVLVMDDEPQIRRFLRIGLGAHGYRLLEAGNATEGLSLCAQSNPDLIILDLGLPDIDGKRVIEEIRSWSAAPIIVLSVRSGETEKIAALDLGANDYVTKPFSIGELMARIRAILRNRGEPEDNEAVLQVGPLALDLAKRRVILHEEVLKLSKKEFELLAYLVKYAGRVLTHRQILREIWGVEHEEDTQYLRVYIGQLRQKLTDDPTRPRFIANEPGVGYRFIAEDPPLNT
jgi:two-component system, OmpR family, KDP operon response regulator KdpE